MKTFLDTNVSKSKTFVLYGNLKDTIWCPDLIPRDIEHYLVKLLKSRGYKNIIFYGEAGTKGAYCLDEESARFFFSANIGIPLPELFSDDFEESVITSEADSREITNQQDQNTTGTGSQVSDALEELFGSDDDEYQPGDMSGDFNAEQEDNADITSNNTIPVQRIRYSYRGQTMSEFLLKIHPLMLKKNSHMAVVFYNILTTDIKSSDLRDDILDIWEKNSKGNICLMLFPETLYNESALENKIKQFGLESKFLRSPRNSSSSNLNPINCFKIGEPGIDEVKNMLRYLAMVGTENKNRIRFSYSEIENISRHIIGASKASANRMGVGFEFMTEIYKRFSDFIDAEYQNRQSWDGRVSDELIDVLYNTQGLRVPGTSSELSDKTPDWGVERVSVEIPEVEEEKTLEQLTEELDMLVGLKTVKEEIRSLIALQKANAWRKANNLPTTTPSLHMVFTGDPGTGKTTVARLIGKVYRALGLLSQGQLIEVGREKLVAPYVGQTAQRTLDAIESARGGVLFIDEAYTLSSGGENDFGQEAIDTLLRHMENNRDDMVVIVAGYPEKMKEFINANEGLQSRFTKYMNFENYSTDELMEILLSYCKMGEYSADESVLEKAKEIMKMGQKYGGRNFGNGRYVRNVYETATSRLAVRIAGMDVITKEQATEFDPEDFVLPANIEADELSSDKKQSLEELLTELDSLVGLANVKTKVNELIDLQKYNLIRKEKGIKAESQSLHMVFTGNPGTGKTVVARLIGKIYHALGLLPQGQLVEVERADLVASYTGQTAQKTLDAIERARGGVLFIDEAYTLSKGGESDFGKEAIDTLLRHMENNRDDLVVIAAGYPDEMQSFISSNPGLNSRFTQFVHFDDYSVDELVEIIKGMAGRAGYGFAEGAINHIQNIIAKKKSGGRDFGNGRYARNLYESAIRRLASRVTAQQEYSDEELTTFVISDFSSPSDLNDKENVQEKTTEQLLEELEHLIGLDQVKVQVRKLINLVNMNKKRAERGIRTTKTSLHMVFTGNPGTGKTTVARLIGELYKSIGILPSGQLVEVGREDLVGQYVGHTAQKTKEVLESAMGGVLFIDEAYTLSNSTSNDFGQEAIDTILRHMENNRDKLVVIVAGYPNEMDRFIKSNPGLKSRFTTTVNFEDYSIDQLMEILELQCLKNGYWMTDAAKLKARHILISEKSVSGYDFGNGRVVRNVFEAATLNQNDRISVVSELTDEELMTLTEEDFS